MDQSGQEFSDKGIVEYILKGNKDAYTLLVEKYKDVLYRISISAVCDCDAAEDITQEAFLIAYKNLLRLNNPSSFKAWLIGITRNLCRDYKRKQIDAPISLDYLSEQAIEIPEQKKTNEIDKDLFSLVKKTIMGLPENYREIMLLRYNDDTSYEKICEILGISMSAVKSRIYHAKKEIIKKLEKEGII